jgi:protein required for attachment to host cells
LIVVAPPHFLGLLRQQMGDALAGAVEHEVTKDLTRENRGALQAHVAELL